MKWTMKQKAAIKGYYPDYQMRFMDDGSVQARHSKRGAYGVLYTPSQAKSHLDAVAKRR